MGLNFIQGSFLLSGISCCHGEPVLGHMLTYVADRPLSVPVRPPLFLFLTMSFVAKQHNNATQLKTKDQKRRRIELMENNVLGCEVKAV